MIKKNVFLVHTEYHLLITINILLNTKIGSEDYKNIIILDKQSKRTSGHYNFEVIKATFIVFDSNKDAASIKINKILEIEPTSFFFFQEINEINQYVIYKLKKKNCEINLVQDGLKPYAKYNKRHEFLSAIKESFILYKKLYKNNIFWFPSKLFWFYRYGQAKVIDGLYLTHPKQYDFLSSKKKIYQIPSFMNHQVSLFKSFFLIDRKTEIYPRQKIILYINQPLINNGHIETEIIFLKRIMESVNYKTKLYIKPHPLTTEQNILKFKNIENVEILKIDMPAELIIAELDKSVILSPWSTALLTENNKCKFYYCFPIFKKNKIMEQIFPNNPTEHIKTIEKPEEIDVSILL